jgi:transcriptional regulator with XRE-family HTH domain
MDTTCGGRIRHARKRLGWGQSALAKALGVTRQNITQIEYNQRQPRADRLRAIALVLHVSGDYLLGLSDDMEATY